jgi:hypothetical protein
VNTHSFTAGEVGNSPCLYTKKEIKDVRIKTNKIVFPEF